MIGVLHDIRSKYNVGSIFRTADAAGVEKIYLTGYSPAPRDDFGRWKKQISKVALGAEKNVPWEKIENISDLLSDLRSDGFRICSVEQTPDSVSITEHEYSQRSVYIFGNEVEGLSEKVLTQSDSFLEIPMFGNKNLSMYQLRLELCHIFTNSIQIIKQRLHETK